MNHERDPIWAVMSLLFKPHPWHGVLIGPNAPQKVTAYIEMVPTDTVKYETDKTTGFLQVDRPQLYSNVCPALYGFLPQTYCAERVAALSGEHSGRVGLKGDGDPLDICVLTEKHITHGDIMLQALPIGGIRMIDGDEADDKIIAVLEGDAAYGAWRDIASCPESLVDRLRHYFLTYKEIPHETRPRCEITHVYGNAEAFEVIQCAREDYREQFGGLVNLLTTTLRG